MFPPSRRRSVSAGELSRQYLTDLSHPLQIVLTEILSQGESETWDYFKSSADALHRAPEAQKGTHRDWQEHKLAAAWLQAFFAVLLAELKRMRVDTTEKYSIMAAAWKNKLESQRGAFRKLFLETVAKRARDASRRISDQFTAKFPMERFSEYHNARIDGFVEHRDDDKVVSATPSPHAHGVGQASILMTRSLVSSSDTGDGFIEEKHEGVAVATTKVPAVDIATKLWELFCR